MPHPLRFATLRPTNVSSPSLANSEPKLNPSNLPSLGDKLQKIGMVDHLFLIALNIVVDERLATIAAEQNADAVNA